MPFRLISLPALAALPFDEIIDVRYDPAKPLGFVVHYAPIHSQQADLTLSLVCKRPKHALQWATALALLRRHARCRAAVRRELRGSAAGALAAKAFHAL